MIPNFTLYICNRTQVANYHDKNVTHLISIGDPGEKKPYIQHWAKKPTILRLEFDDVVDESWVYEKGWEGPQEKHVVQIIRFACEIEEKLKRGEKVVLLVHCFAGISRSTGTAYTVLNVLAGMGKEKACFDAVLRVRDCAIPNPIIAKFADNLLDRRGELYKYAAEYRKYIEDSFKAKEES